MVSGLNKYSSYKDSGIEWIGEIPEHWEVKKIKHSDMVVMGQSPSSDDYNESEIGLPFLQGNADFTQIYPEPRIWCDVANKIAEKDNVLLSVRAPVGAVNIANRKYGIGRGLCAIRAVDSCSRFLFYMALTLETELRSIATGSTYEAVSADDVKNTFIPYIARPEQQAIADYLDKKTALIGELIGKKRRQIELLKEQRQAVINQAVTKGLDPDVEMKDSGIEWLGEIPEHWEVKKIKFLLRRHKSAIKTGPFGSQLKSIDFRDEGIKVYNQRNVLDGNFEQGEIYISPEKYEELQAFEIFPNDILITTRGTIGKCAIFPPDAKKGVLHPCLIRMQLDQNKVINEYIVCYIQDTSFFEENVHYNSDATTIDVIYSDTLKEVQIPTPPLDEQRDILAYVQTGAKKLENTANKAEKQIQLLQEYRTALISEAVTGKIDVRMEN